VESEHMNPLLTLPADAGAVKTAIERTLEAHA
jgi:hypothetical protein